MVELSYGVAGNGQKWPKMAGNGRKITNFSVVHGGSRRRLAGPIPVCPTAVRREIPPAGSSGCCAPPRPAHVAGGSPVVSRLVRSLTARN